MASVYPGGLDSFATNKADATVTATDHPAHHNDLADAVNKIEGELGIAPSGAAATVVARLNAMTVFSGARIYKSVDQANVTDGVVVVTFNTAEFDTDSYFDDANDKLVAPSTGYYLVSATFSVYQGTIVSVMGLFSDPAQQLIFGRISETDASGALPVSQFSASGSTLLQLDVGESVGLNLNVDSDGANNIDIRGGSIGQTSLSIVRLGT